MDLFLLYNSLLSLFLIFYSHVNGTYLNNNNTLIQTYLNSQEEYVEKEISTTTGNRLHTDVALIKLSSTVNIQVPKNYTNTHGFFFTNQSYIILGADVFQITSQLKNVTKFSVETNVSFAKSVNFFGSTFLSLTLDNGVTNLYRSVNESTEFNFINSISNENPTDVTFYTFHQNLYLVICNDADDHFSKTSTYIWTGTQFDEIQQLYLTESKALNYFSFKNQEIIILLQQSARKENFQARYSIFEAGSSGLSKIQELEIQSCRHTLPYEFENELYVASFGKEKNHTVFWWNGFELVEWFNFTTEEEVEKAVVHFQENTPIIFTIEKNKIISYAPNHEVVRRLSDINLKSPAVKILDLKVFNIKNSTTLQVITFSKDSLLNHIESFLVNITLISRLENHDRQQNALKKCMIDLDLKVVKIKEESHQSKSENASRPIKMISSSMKLKSLQNKTTAAAYRSSGVVNKMSTFDELTDELRNTLKKIEQQVSSTKKQMDKYHTLNNNTLILDGSAIINGDIKTKQLNSSKIIIKQINKKKWVPENWLSYTSTQIIDGNVTLSRMNTIQLQARDNDLFKDLLLKNRDQVIKGSTRLNNLKCKRFYTKTINKIPVDGIYLKSQPMKIKGIKEFRFLTIGNATIKKLNTKSIEDFMKILFYKASKSGNLDVENLIVNNINGTNWESFKDSVFKIGVDDTIKGNINFEKLKADYLRVSRINNINSDELLTTSTNQTITSSIKFRNIFARNVNANKINGINYGKEAAVFNNTSNLVIKGPVRINNLNAKNITISQEALNNMFKNHIKGTNNSDLVQIYEKHVKIKGDLIVKNLIIPDKTKLILGTKRVSPNILNEYWTKSGAQMIPVFVEAKMAVTTPHVITEKINGVAFSDYMLNKREFKKPTNYYFENITVLKNIELNPNENHSPNLTDIEENSVKVDGTFVIKGKKTFLDNLLVDHLKVESLDGNYLRDILIKESPAAKITGTKTFENVMVLGNFSSQNHETNVMNNVFLDDLIEHTLYINKEARVENIIFENASVEAVHTPMWNDYNISEHIKNRTNNKNHQIQSISNVFVDGQVNIYDIKSLSKLNGVPVNDIFNESLNPFKNGILNQSVQFSGHTFVNNLNVKTINGLYLPNITSRLLYKKWDQNITAKYKFKNLMSENIITREINNITVTDFINKRSMKAQHIPLKKVLKFSSPVTINSLYSDGLPCDIRNATLALNLPKQVLWDTMVVNGNVTTVDNTSVIDHIIKKAVRSSRENIIEKPVIFSKNLQADNIFIKTPINSIDLEKIFDDAVLETYENEQVIRGRKTFEMIAAEKVTAEGNLDVPSVNDIIIPDLRDSIITREEINTTTITGKKVFFGGLQTKLLNVSTISNINVDRIVDQKKVKLVKNAALDSFSVQHNMSVKTINQMNFERILEQRLLCNGSGIQEANVPLFFENVILRGETKVKVINSIALEDVIIDEGLQTIESTKKFSKPVNIFGNSNMGVINGKSLSEMYENGIKKGERNRLKGTIIIEKPSKFEGNIYAKKINGVPVEAFNEVMRTKLAKSSSASSNIIDEITEVMKVDLKLTKQMPKEYMYVEKSTDLQIILPNATNAKVVTMNENILMHITAEADGHSCGLPNECPCFVQETAIFTPEKSVHTFFEKGLQRVYSYDDEEITVHFITNSLSTSEDCRTSRLKPINEDSTLTWSTKSINNKTGRFYLHPRSFYGYITGVEFFKFNGVTYGVIARYYDPILRTKKLNCTVIKFSTDKATVEEIQQIPTNGAWVLHFFYTAQRGAVLIIGNIKDGKYEEDENTEIFVFDSYEEKFILLREVPSYGSIAAASAEFGTESAIILAHKTAPLQILKYDPDRKNYYFYQSIEFNSPVSSVNVFYTGDFGISDAYLTVVTEKGGFFIYKYKFIEGWILESSGELEGLRALIPFKLKQKIFLFASSNEMKSLLTVVQSGV